MRMLELYDHDLIDLSLFSTPEEVEKKILNAVINAGFDIDKGITKIRDDKLQVTVYMQETSFDEEDNTIELIQSFYENRRG